MTGGREQATREIEEALTDIGWRLAALLGTDVWDMIRQRAAEVAPMLVHQLAQEDDDRLAGQTAIDLMCCLWPHGDPEVVGEPEWWSTALGRLVARSAGRSDAESVSHSVAAAMLGVHRGTVAQLVARGTLDRHPDGGVLRASVLQRLTR